MDYENLATIVGDPERKVLIPVPREQYAHWTRGWSEPFCIDNFFNEDELEWLTDIMYREHYARRVKRVGTLHFVANYEKIQRRFFAKLKEIIPTIDVRPPWEGNFLITSSPYNVHIDTGLPEYARPWVPGKQILIPLWTCYPDRHPREPECGTAFFRNRFIMQGVNFAKASADYETRHFCTIRQYDDLQCFSVDGSPRSVDWNRRYIDDQTYANYFSHIHRREWLDGFEFETYFNWVRGRIIVFDRCQAHSGINFIKNGVTMKCGLSLMTTVMKD